MQKIDLTEEDRELVKAAGEAVKQPIRQIFDENVPALVGAALRLDDGQILTGVNMTVDVGSLSQCAEPFAIAQANRQIDRHITAIVAVYREMGYEPKVIPPCGRCREAITDFLPAGFVILREPESDTLFKVRAVDLLPLKYGDYWKDGNLV
jgi:cytidine deaminase